MSRTKTRLSTNEQFELILNRRAEDDEDEDIKRERKIKLKNKLHRSIMYGSGSRGKLPHIQVQFSIL